MQSFDFNIKSVYQAYLDSIFAIRDMSAKIDTSQNVSVDDKIITLSTCYGRQAFSRAGCTGFYRKIILRKEEWET